MRWASPLISLKRMSSYAYNLDARRRVFWHLRRKIRRGDSRISLCLVSAIRSAVAYVIVTIFLFDVAAGLIAVAAVSFFFFSLAFGVASFSGCGGCVSF